MDGLLLLCGHLLGDYILQNDWMATNKVNPHPGPDPARFGSNIIVNFIEPELSKLGRDYGFDVKPEDANIKVMKDWLSAERKWRIGHLACTLHCLLYTLAVWACSFWWMPWWGLVACFALHWPIDRFRLAGRWMRNVSGQKAFATGALSPWSVIVVDNIAHIVTLGVIGKLAIL